MANFELMRKLSIKTDSKIVFLIIDGLGGLPRERGGGTEVEEAKTPNLDALARESICGMIDPISPGITPGSGPAHLALFGYDPVRYQVGRGVLAALGIGFDLKPSDVSARFNFATVDDEGKVVDRRAGRIPSEEGRRLCQLLEEIRLPRVTIFVKPVKEYRGVLILRGENLSGDLSDSDPQEIGVPPRRISPLSPEAKETAELVNQFVEEARRKLSSEHPANFILLRGFDRYHPFPTMTEIYKLTPASIASYPMYRGVTKLIGMELLKTGDTLAEELKTLRENYQRFDFFYVHIKKTDSAGEDGDFERKASLLEEVDQVIPEILALSPEVLVITGDHSTPAMLKAHSWHPVPVLLHSRWCRPDKVERFSEREFNLGGLGRIPATELMPLAMANALKLAKYGA